GAAGSRRREAGSEKREVGYGLRVRGSVYGQRETRHEPRADGSDRYRARNPPKRLSTPGGDPPRESKARGRRSRALDHLLRESPRVARTSSRRRLSESRPCRRG